MKLDLFDINKFIEANHCKPVTSPIFFQYDGNPTPNGLFSYDIFGMSDEDRKNIFAYIDLNGHFIHPLIYILMIGRMGSLRDILYGKKYAVIADKKIRIVPENAQGALTGLDFFYNNFDNINWIDELEESEIDSIDKKTRLKFLKHLKKEEFFIDKWLVLPPFYRDQSSTNLSMGDSINNLYKELISKTKSLKSGFSFELFGNETKLRIQNLLKDLYYTTTAPVSGKHLIIEKGKTEGTLTGSGKNSIIRKHLLGKTIDWTASCVITSPQNNKAKNVGEKPIPFGYGAFPLATILSLFHPFFVAEGVQVLEDILTIFANEYMNDIKRINVSQFNTDEVEKMLKKFITSPNNRFDKIEFVYTDNNGKQVKKNVMIYESKDNKNFTPRELTLADLAYILAMEIVRDKHVYVTRYPIADFQNIYPSKVKVLSTAKSRKVYLKIDEFDERSTYYDDYPTIGGNSIDSRFYDVMVCGNPYLESLGGDYDGDMLYLKPVFTKEANAEAEKLIYSKSNLFMANGTLSRTLTGIGKENVMGLYELTKSI